jgi:hypothetical protein
MKLMNNRHVHQSILNNEQQIETIVLADNETYPSHQDAIQGMNKSLLFINVNVEFPLMITSRSSRSIE